MAMATKLTVIFFFLSLLAISSLTSMALASKNQGDVNRLYGQNSLKSYQCPSECSRRCSKTQYKKPCLFFCNKCCNKCLCVPPGYYGNKGVCACYNNWKTKRGGPKCP